MSSPDTKLKSAGAWMWSGCTNSLGVAYHPVRQRLMAGAMWEFFGKFLDSTGKIAFSAGTVGLIAWWLQDRHMFGFEEVPFIEPASVAAAIFGYVIFLIDMVVRLFGWGRTKLTTGAAEKSALAAAEKAEAAQREALEAQNRELGREAVDNLDVLSVGEVAVLKWVFLQDTKRFK